MLRWSGTAFVVRTVCSRGGGGGSRGISNHARIVAHYLSLGDDLPSSTSLATQELRWLSTEAKRQSRHIGGETAKFDSLLTSMVERLVRDHMPIAYIIGNQPFHPLELPLLVRPPTLIPRPETENWVNLLASQISSLPPLTTFKVLDIGTGTGCIPLGLIAGLDEWGGAGLSAVGVDLSMQAVDLARENVQIQNLSSKIKIAQVDLFSPSFSSDALAVLPSATREGDEDRYNLIISNPPYITRKEFLSLAPSVKDWEDRMALVGERFAAGEDGKEEEEDDGLIFYRRIISLLPSLLASPTPLLRQSVPSTPLSDADQARSPATTRGAPCVVLEVGENQARVVKGLLENAGYSAEIQLDQWEIERVVLGYPHSNA